MAPGCEGARGVPGGSSGQNFSALVLEVQREFERGRFKSSGLAGSFRHAAKSGTWQRYLASVEALGDLGFLLGDVLVHFYRLGETLGDYGVMRVGSWFHPFLDALLGKLNQLRVNLTALASDVDTTYVLGKAKGAEVEKPSPSSKMSGNAHAAMERAVTGRGAHLPTLVQALDELKTNSQPDRLPHVMKDLGDACKALETVLWSSEFRAIVGKNFADLPPVGDVSANRGGRGGAPQLMDRERTPALAETSAGALARRFDASKASAFGMPEQSPQGEAAGHGTPHKRGQELEAPAVPRIMVSAAPSAAVAGERGGVLRARVQSMTAWQCGGELRATGCQDLALSRDKLVIGGESAAKTTVDLRNGIEECRLRDLVLLTLTVLQPAAGSAPEDGVLDHKAYTFRFDSASLAAAFHSRLAARASPW